VSEVRVFANFAFGGLPARLMALHPGPFNTSSGNVHYLPLTAEPGLVAAVQDLIPDPVALDTILLSAIWPGPFVHVEHADNCVRGGGPNHTAHRTWTALLYLTEPVGGELVFTDLGLAIAPKPGLLVVSPAHLFHKTEPVREGPVRYSLNLWFKRPS
jgi:hypothetical protein